MTDGTVLVVGGSGAAGFLAVSQIYDPVTNSWSQTASMSTARAQHTATLFPNGMLLVAEGQNGGLPLASSEIYDPSAHSRSSAASMSTVRASHAACSTSLRNRARNGRPLGKHEPYVYE
jgi:hypothetical protein